MGDSVREEGHMEYDLFLFCFVFFTLFDLAYGITCRANGRTIAFGRLWVEKRGSISRVAWQRSWKPTGGIQEAPYITTLLENKAKMEVAGVAEGEMRDYADYGTGREWRWDPNYGESGTQLVPVPGNRRARGEGWQSPLSPCSPLLSAEERFLRASL